MTQNTDTFDEISFSFTNSGALRSAVEASISKIRRQRESGFAHDIVRGAWNTLPEAALRQAFDDLCTAYYTQLSEARRAHEHDALGTSGTYLQPDDLPLIHEALMNAAPIDEDTVIDGYLGGSLERVLKELELLRYRLAIAQHDRP
ncbi:hypothetical protein ACFYY2_29810 [Streptomyces sp. NPDC001822]|uniref:hypothetical protein n=1 Tax=Streptomyces sp. NPDC001822 TaxID=3364614 RepID=UPI0036B2FCEF